MAITRVKKFKPEDTQTLMDNYAEKHHAWYNNWLSKNIMEKKYLHPEEKTACEFINRVCSVFTNDSLKNRVRSLMIEGSFFPGGRTLYAAGSKGKFNACCSNCFILPSVYSDSLEGIYESNKEIAQIFKAGGGIGIDLSTLRPNGARTNNAARTSTGAVSFIHLYNATGSIIGFHGRRGATLVGLRISHPDIEEFVELRKNYDLKAMNISCVIDDKFMETVKKNEDYELYFYVEATGEEIRKTINARDLYHKICYMNWDYGDPGMLFKHAVDEHNLMAHNDKFHIEICNPCAEYTGPAYNSCNLGSLNLYNYVENKFTDHAEFDYDAFAYDVMTAVEALDEILDYGYELQPLDMNRKIIDEWRSIGLGFFGFADAMVALRIKYGSKESIEFAESVSHCLMTSSIEMSSILGKRKGSFGNFNLESTLKSTIFDELKDFNNGKDYAREKIKENKALRNAQLVSIAPTGSLALLAGSLSSGIEPIFKCAYERSSHGLEDSGVHFSIADKAIQELLEFHNMDLEKTSSEEIKKKFPWVVEAADINPMDRVKVQAAIQRYIDNAISSTVNLPESATVEEIEQIYMKAWESGLKGITVFRDNCKRASILGFAKKKDDKTDSVVMDSVKPISRKEKGALSGRTYRRQTACVRSMYITINHDEDGNIFEVFTNKSIHGCSANIATITRLTSLALRSGISVEEIISELKENACQSCQDLIRKGHKEISKSCPYAIGDALEEEYNFLKNKKVDKKDETSDDEDKSREINSEKKENSTPGLLECPECGERTLLVEGKCTSCKSCGYSKCD